jgi:DNA polymerase-1
MRSRSVAIDAHSLIYRAFHAAAHRVGPENVNVAPVVHGLLRGVVNTLQPHFLLAAADRKEPSFRHELEPQYKATRKPKPPQLSEQIGIGLTVFSDLGIPVYTAAGFEADDVLATLAGTVREGHLLTIVSSDRDLAALVSDTVHMHLVRNGEPLTVTPANVTDLFGVSADRICDYKALVGDPSDNISGVPGVGPKKALALIDACADLDEMVTRASEFGRAGALLVEHEDKLRLSYRLAELRQDVPCSFDAASARWTSEKHAALNQ